MSFVSQATELYESWGKLCAKNEPFYSSVRIDDEAIELLSPFFSQIAKHKGLYLLGFVIEQERNSFPKVSFTVCARPYETYVRSELETMNFVQSTYSNPPPY